MKPKLKKLSRKTILLQWTKSGMVQIHQTREMIHRQFKEVLETVPAYRELAIYLHFGVDIFEFIPRLEKALEKVEASNSGQKSSIYKIPVCYQAEFGLDMEALAKSKNLSIDEVIRLHTEANYQIHFLGFLPGFPYLSGLDPKLEKARLPSPRSKISAGSVGIAGKQTGIYPQDSPGGWNIIGRSPLKLFDIQQSPPALLKPIHQLQFFAIDRKEYEEIQVAVSEGEYQLEVSHD